MLAEQIAYYRARAGEYDDWWYRRGRYALPPDLERDVARGWTASARWTEHGMILHATASPGS